MERPVRSALRSAPASGAAGTQRLYNALLPYYAEVCALSQSKRIGVKPGGWAGHAALFLNGAEIDPSASFPRLRLVADQDRLADEDSGVGVSVNRIFRNVNWVAIPGRARFFRGGLDAEATLDETAYDSAVRRAAAEGWFDGVTIAPEVMRQRPADVSEQEWIVRHSIGTDFAVNFARDAYCARLPLSREALSRVVEHLNGLNERAQREPYVWNAYTNNCTHVIHNALAATGVWDAKHTRGTRVLDVVEDVLSVAGAVATRRMSDLSFPANSFVRLYEAGNERPIDDAVAAFADHDVVRTMEDGWISTAPGALVAVSPMLAHNTLFVRGHTPLLFSVPVLWDKGRVFRTLTDPPARVRDLGANLAAFRSRYTRILARRRGEAEEVRRVPRPARDRFRVFRARFYEYIASEVERTETLVAEHRRRSATSFAS